MSAMRFSILLILPLFILSGCSGTSNILQPDTLTSLKTEDSLENRQDWGIWDIAISADHTSLEVIPNRYSNFHYNVTRFLEGDPCPNCLTISQPEIQPDGTIKIWVTLRHPFPGAPKYTGFDVRGMVYFPPTKEQITDELPYLSRIYYDINGGPTHGLFPPPYFQGMPLIFSSSKHGGAELLNNDGYSCYLIPGLTYSLEYPIFSYYEPEQNQKPTPELTTINPYKLFASDNNRRMFLVTDEITREYHLTIPPGPFKFGYAVDASWWHPDQLPVTNPALDFPPQANAEDPWKIEYEQLLPIAEENINEDIFKITVHHRGLDGAWGVDIFSWDFTLADDNNPKNPTFSYTALPIDQFTSQVYGRLTWAWWEFRGKDGLAIPGHHLAVLTVATNPDLGGPPYLAELDYVIGATIIDIYIEE